MIDCEESVFKFEKLTGTVLANSKITVIIRFCPTHPINYYKRLACMVHNQVIHFCYFISVLNSIFHWWRHGHVSGINLHWRNPPVIKYNLIMPLCIIMLMTLEVLELHSFFKTCSCQCKPTWRRVLFPSMK